MSTGDSKNRRAGIPAGAPAAAPAGAPARARSGQPKAPAAPAAARKKSGRVKFDARGNAVWEWAVATGAFGREVSTERMKTLENEALSLAEDAPTPFDLVQPNPLGTVKGYNPYDSGKLGRTQQQPPKKTDLRKLGDWLKLKKQVADRKDED